MDPKTFNELTPGSILHSTEGRSFKVVQVGETWRRADGTVARLVRVEGHASMLTVTEDDKRYGTDAGLFIYARRTPATLRLVATNTLVETDAEKIQVLGNNHPLGPRAREAMWYMLKQARKGNYRTASLQTLAERTRTPIEYRLVYIKGDNKYRERVLVLDA